jgi:hypothetical protein
MNARTIKDGFQCDLKYPIPKKSSARGKEGILDAAKSTRERPASLVMA